jgi:hypothetical protein
MPTGGRSLSRQQSAVDSGRAFLARLDEPVRLAFPLVEFPAEELAVELDRALGLLGLDLEMDGTRHYRLLVRRQRRRSRAARSRKRHRGLTAPSRYHTAA